MFGERGMHRHPLASDMRHPLFRAQSESWLEFLVRQDVTRAHAQQFTRRFWLAWGASTVSWMCVLQRDADVWTLLELEANEDPGLPPAARIGCGSNARRNKVTFCITSPLLRCPLFAGCSTWSDPRLRFSARHRYFSPRLAFADRSNTRGADGMLAKANRGIAAVGRFW
jgi:hypothetical protein